MNLGDLLKQEGLDSEHVFVLRHRPGEPSLRKVLPWLAAEKPEVFNAYQQTQGEKLEKALASQVGQGHVASFISHGPGRALFVGLYSIDGARPLTRAKFWKIPAYVELKAHGMAGWTEATKRSEILWFDLTPTAHLSKWKGRLIVSWPPPERSWWRRAHRNTFPVEAIVEDSVLDAAMPNWIEIDLSWEELQVIPTRWQAALSQWRAIYFIHDSSDGMGYVGSAAGEQNLLGRWTSYASDGHGGNRLLKGRDPRSLRFTILERVSPDMDPADVVRLEATWKVRLHTRTPGGLNDN